jgi:outer membrane protein
MLRRVALLVVLGSLVTPAVADGVGPVEVYRRALSADAEYQQAKYRLDVASESYTQAKAGYLPKLNWQYERTDSKQDLISSSNQVFQVGENEFDTDYWELSLNQPLFRYSEWVTLGQGKKQVAQGEVLYVQAKQDLVLRVSEAYLAVLAAQDELTYLTAQESSVAERLRLAVGREQANISTRIERMEIDALNAMVRADMSAAYTAISDATDRVYQLSGEYLSNLKKLQQDIPINTPDPVGVDNWIDRAFADNFRIVAQQLAVDVADIEYKKKKGAHYPTLDLVLTSNSRETGGTLFGGGSEVDTEEVMLRLNVPLYSGGQISSQRRTAAANANIARQEFVKVRREIASEVRSAYYGLINSLERIPALKKSASAQEQSVLLLRAGLKAGVTSLTDLLDAEQTLFSVRRDLRQSQYDYLLKMLRLKATVGQLDEADLAAIERLAVAAE